MISDYLLLAAIVFGVNLLPAFGPPTWSVIVVLVARGHLAVLPTVAVAAVCAAAGRFVLAQVVRRFFRGRLSVKRQRSLGVAEKALTKSRTRKYAALGIFAFSPVPSAQLFVAAGLMQVRLLPLTLGFFAGRLCSYAIYATLAKEIDKRADGSLLDAMTSPLGIAIELVALGALIAFVRIDWARVGTRFRAARRRRRRRAKR